MSKIEKKKKRLMEQIASLKGELQSSLSNKSSTVEMDISSHMQKIAKLELQLKELK